MASKDLVLAQPFFASSKKKRSRGRKRQPPAAAPKAGSAAFSDLEQAFFDAAPPDAPAAVEPESFDDLAPRAAAGPDLFGAWREALAAVAALLAQLPARLRAQRGAIR